ncbi:hypothetical protein M23134_02554 [Microscilla marina ATCC 23134]|uniref:Uncharacterized protein n=1 Tax=Microscilla marina ATCC 23134 TaxID=313606 RepID=A1ZTX0_MICM2|nr:hypothetical protein M23134_02554 [Microscilla marina ATCC 23134]
MYARKLFRGLVTLSEFSGTLNRGLLDIDGYLYKNLPFYPFHRLTY